MKILSSLLVIVISFVLISCSSQGTTETLDSITAEPVQDVSNEMITSEEQVKETELETKSADEILVNDLYNYFLRVQCELNGNVSSLNALLSKDKDVVLSFKQFNPNKESKEYETITKIQKNPVFVLYADSYVDNKDKLNFDDGLVMNGYVRIVSALVDNILLDFDGADVAKASAVSTIGDVKNAKAYMLSYVNDLIKDGADVSCNSQNIQGKECTFISSSLLPIDKEVDFYINPCITVYGTDYDLCMGMNNHNIKYAIQKISFNTCDINTTQMEISYYSKYDTNNYLSYICKSDFTEEMNKKSFNDFKAAVLGSKELVVSLNDGETEITLNEVESERVKVIVSIFDCFLTALNTL